MRIAQLDITNVLNFGPDTFTIQFPLDQRLHLLIGPNGTGKSNLIDVISYVFQKWLLRPAHIVSGVFNEPSRIKQGNFRGAAQWFGGSRQPLPSTWGHEAAESRIVVTITLTETDRANFELLLSEEDSIRTALETYSNENWSIQGQSLTLSATKALKELRLEFVRPAGSEHFEEPQITSLDPGRTLDGQEEHFLRFYFRNFDLIRKVLMLAEQRDGLLPGTAATFRQPFIFLSAHRNITALQMVYSPSATPHDEVTQYEADRHVGRTARTTEGDSAAFEIFKRSIAIEFMEHLDAGGTVAAEAKILSSKRLVGINTFLKELGYELRVVRRSRYTFELEFQLIQCATGTPVDFNALSSGQREVIILFIALFSDNLEDGQVVVDEPELHLHPQMQKLLLNGLQRITEKSEMQCVIATHSPAFITARTIRGAQRFNKNSGTPAVVAFSSVDAAKTTELARMLSYTNSASVLFAENAVLVEGPGDQFFFSLLFDLLPTTAMASRTGTYEFLSVGGKQQIRKWLETLCQLGIRTSAIADFGFLSEATQLDLFKDPKQLAAASKQVDKAVAEKQSIDRLKIIDLLRKIADGECDEHRDDARKIQEELLRRHAAFTPLAKTLRADSDVWVKVEECIAALAKEQIYVLSRGELETYIPLSGRKQLGKVMTACEGFDPGTWQTQQGELATELITILETIVSRS